MQEQDTTAIPAAPEAPQLQPQPQKSVQKQTGLGGFFADLVVTAIIAAVTAFAVFKFAPQLIEDSPVQAQKFAVVDMEKLSREHILALTAQVRTGELEASDMTAKTREFAQALMDRMHEVSAQGIIVLNASAVASMPADVQDLTQTLQEQLQAAGQMPKRSTQ